VFLDHGAHSAIHEENSLLHLVPQIIFDIFIQKKKKKKKKSFFLFKEKEDLDSVLVLRWKDCRTKGLVFKGKLNHFLGIFVSHLGEASSQVSQKQNL